MMYIIFQILLIILYLGILAVISIDDYDFMTVDLIMVLLLSGISSCFLILTGLFLISLTYFLLLLMLFGIPCLFNFGLGDLLVFLSMAPILAIGDIKIFLFLFFICWLIWHFTMVGLKIKDGTFKSFSESLSKKNVFTVSYPLVPVIFFSLLIWLLLVAIG